MQSKLHFSLLLVTTRGFASFAAAFVHTPSVITPPARIDVINSPPLSSPGTSNTNPFVVANSPTLSTRTRSLHVLKSAKIIPYAFRTVSVGLVFRAARMLAYPSLGYTKFDASVMTFAASMGYFYLADEHNNNLKSAKRAVKRIQQNDEKAEGAKQIGEEERNAAKSYKKAVNIRIVGQFLSLFWMACFARTGPGILMGVVAAAISTIVFLFLGGGRNRHNASGRLEPMSPEAIQNLYSLETSMVVAALMLAATYSRPWTASKAILTFGFFGAVLQGKGKLKM